VFSPNIKKPIGKIPESLEVTIVEENEKLKNRERKPFPSLASGSDSPLYFANPQGFLIDSQLKI